MNIEVTYVVDVSRDGRRVATGFNPSPVECSPFNIGPMHASVPTWPTNVWEEKEWLCVSSAESDPIRLGSHQF